MRIESFWARGYRSLREVRIEGLGAFNVFYGPNGGGKSNILAGIQALIELAAEVMRDEGANPGVARPADTAIAGGLIQRRDLCARDVSRTITLGAQFSGLSDLPPALAMSSVKLSALSLEVTLDWIIEREPMLSITKLESDGKDLRVLWRELPVGSPELRDRRPLRGLLRDGLPRAFDLVGADRIPRPEKATPAPDSEDVVGWHLRQGRMKSAILMAHIAPKRETRQRLDSLRALLMGEPLCRPAFDPVQDPRTSIIDLHERFPEPNPEWRDVSIDLAGLGIAQIYGILAKVMLSGARMIGIEEPEAHLHAPTSGRALRQLLIRLVEEKHIDQLFIATHSNLFDLDPTGYFDVSLVDGSTVVKRSDLTKIDHDHLYEPGPAKHALQRMLGYTPEDEIVFRRPDGSGVTAKEMLKLLQEDDDLAVRFLQDIHGAAVRMVKVQQKAKKPEAG